MSFTDSPIFICGEGRSGTKLLKDCLSQHSKLYSLTCETYFFVDSRFQKLRFIDQIKDQDTLIKAVITALISKNKPTAEKIIKEANYAPRLNEYLADIKALIPQDTAQDKFTLFNICANYLAKKNAKQKWIEKTPYHIYYIEKILSYYPNAKFIVNFRDPRAVYASWKRKDTNKTLFGVIDTWNKVASRIAKLKESKARKIYFMKYEDLISDPEKVLKEICSFVGEEFEEQLLDVNVVNSFYEDKKTKGFSKAALERWKTNLKAEEILLIDFLTKSNRAALSYSDYPVNTNALRVSWALFTAVILYLVKKLTKLLKWVKLS